MDWAFGSFEADLLWAVLFGALGGLGFGLLQEKGLEMPHLNSDGGARFIDLGFISYIIVGALAALITYGIGQPKLPLQLMVATLPAGVGGTAVLKSYISGKAALENGLIADEALDVARQVVGGEEEAEGLIEGDAAGLGIPNIGNRDPQATHRASANDEAKLGLARSRIARLEQARGKSKRRWGG